MPLLVRFGSICCHTSTLRLSTRSSFWEVIGNSYLGVSFALNMLSALIYSEHSYSAMQQVATTDTLPSSRTTLTGEQPDPWKVLPLQDVMSRHRGAKPRRLCELLDAIMNRSSIQRVICSHFRVCLGCSPHSQAGFCAYTIITISIRD